MRKSELLRALRTEIQQHNLSTFMHEQHRVVITGCSFCRKHFGTVEPFKRHITEDVLAELVFGRYSPKPTHNTRNVVDGAFITTSLAAPDNFGRAPVKRCAIRPDPAKIAREVRT